MMTDILSQIPRTLLSQVEWAIGAITRADDTIRQCRATHAFTGSSGPYEWEYRTGMTGQAKAAAAGLAVRLLERFCERARQLGVDPEAVLAALEGERTPLPWSEANHAWLDSEPGEAAPSPGAPLCLGPGPGPRRPRQGAIDPNRRDRPWNPMTSVSFALI